MAIKVSGNTIIEDTRTGTNVASVNFADGTSFTTGGVVLGEPVGGVGALMWTLDNPNAYSTSAGDNFGQSVSISGNYAIVGTLFEDDAGGSISGKAYIFNVTTGQLVWTLNNPNAYSTGEFDYFGSSVAISGNYAIVGAKNEDDAGGTTSGKAYIFNVTTGQLVWTLNNPNAYSTSESDNFGYSVAISGNYAIVTAHQEDDSGGTNSGKAYIFNVTTGALLWTLNNPNVYSTSAGDQFGISVSISGQYAIIGTWGEDDTSGLVSGKAYIFNVATGQLVWTLNNPNVYSTSEGDNFGWSVAISGNYAIVSAMSEDNFGGSTIQSGAAYIFNVTTGALVHTLNNPTAYSSGQSDYFGSSVAISGNYAIVGASSEDDAGSGSGKAYIFNVTTGQLVWTLNNPNAYGTSAGDSFGAKLSISGNYVLVSSSSDHFFGTGAEDDAGGSDSGKAYIFTLAPTTDFRYVEEIEFSNGTTVNFLADKAFQTAYVPGQLVWTLNNPNAYSTSQDDQFGYSVAISGNYVIVGSYEDDASGGASGKAYIYNVTTGQLLYTLNNPNAYSTGANDSFGSSVAISGNYAIVGASFEEDAGGTESGKAYIFNVTTGALVWTLNNPTAYSTSSGDYFGRSVAISGNYAIVGAYFEDDAGGTESGKAYIYNVTTGQLLYTLNNPNAYSLPTDDNFGNSVAISGNYAIVGVYKEDDATGAASGKAYIYNVTTGQLLYTLNNPNAYASTGADNFGISVAISGNYAIVGAQQEESVSGDGQSGRAYIFNVTTGQLLWTLNNPNAYSTSGGDEFGYSVAISGNYAIVAAIKESDSSGTTSGKAYIYNVTTGQLLYTLNNPNAYSTSLNDYFGESVAISDNYAIVGVWQEDDSGGSSSGKAYIFSVTNQTYLDKIITVGNSIF